MNIQAAIELYFGGPGSGPNAPCPNCGPHNKIQHQLQEGDTVKLTHPAKMFHEKSGDNRTIPAGTKATVLNILPKVGTADQMMSVHVEGHDPDYIPMNHAELSHARTEDLPIYTKPWFKPSPESDKAWRKQDIQPVPKSQTIMTTTTSDGAKLTWVKPKDEEAPDYKSMQQLSREPHSLKGDFIRQATVPVYNPKSDEQGKNTVTRMYDTSLTPQQARMSNSGATIWVKGTTSEGKITGVNIREQNYTQHAQTTSTITFEYKNSAKAVGMLKKRYGISLNLKSLRGGE